MVAVEIVQALEEADFFKGLDPHQIHRVAALCELRDCHAGEFVYQQGDSGGQLFIIVEGQVVLEGGGHRPEGPDRKRATGKRTARP